MMNAHTNHNDTPDIDDVERLSESDTACMLELQEILQRHGKDTRFGMALLHKHFELSPDEVMLEKQDLTNRILTSAPVRVADLEMSLFVPTLWRLDEGSIRVTAGCAGSGGTSSKMMSHYGYKD